MAKRWSAWFVVVAVCLGVWSVGGSDPAGAASETDASTSIATTVPEGSLPPTFDGAEVTGTDDVLRPDSDITTNPYACPPFMTPRDNGCVPLECEYGFNKSGRCESDSPSFRYHTLTCKFYSTDADARAYLDMDPNKNDRAVCPPPGLFLASPGTDDWPSWGFQKNVADDYGKIVVEKSGECSGPKDDWGLDFPDTGTAVMAIALTIYIPYGLGPMLAYFAKRHDVIVWDFQVPCKAHDHCFDLIRAGLSGTVTIDDCHERMNELMGADCNNRKPVETIFCHGVRLMVYDTVKTFSKAAPDPGLVRLVNSGTGLCADIDRSVLPNGQLSDGFADNTKVLQWPCRTFNAENQQFRVRPASFPGLFEIVPEHSSHLDKCITAVTTLFLTTCYSEPSGSGERTGSSEFQSFKIDSTGIDGYTISGKGLSGRCWTIPSINKSVIPRRGTGLTNVACANSSDRAYQTWRIQNV